MVNQSTASVHLGLVMSHRFRTILLMLLELDVLRNMFHASATMGDMMRRGEVMSRTVLMDHLVCDSLQIHCAVSKSYDSIGVQRVVEHQVGCNGSV